MKITVYSDKDCVLRYHVIGAPVFEDQKTIKNYIIEQWWRVHNSVLVIISNEIYQIEIQGKVEIVNACNYDCCTSDGACEHCQKLIKIARIVLEQKEETQEELWEEVKMLVDTYSNPLPELKIRFTITRK